MKKKGSTINNVTKYITYVTCEVFLEKAIKKPSKIEGYK